MYSESYTPFGVGSPIRKSMFIGFKHQNIAYRSCTRPSSSPNAKASTKCSFAFDFFLYTQMNFFNLIHFFVDIFMNFIEKCGGGEGIRTPDPLLAKQMLYQLSYTPLYSGPRRT